MTLSPSPLSPSPPAQLTLAQWGDHYATLHAAGLVEAPYGGPLQRHLADGDLRLAGLRFDNSPAALALWNLLLTENSRLQQARAHGTRLIGTMKDLGTVPVLVYAYPKTLAFYPDGAWWVPCIMQHSTRDLAIADRLGIDESFCPVRALLGAFATGQHFPTPDLLICSVGATCDDFSAIAQRLSSQGHPITWWEIPARRHPDPPPHSELAVTLPGGIPAPRAQVDFVHGELARLRDVLNEKLDHQLTDVELAASINAANEIRGLLCALRQLVFTAPIPPLPALELLIAEMLAIHYCSDRAATHTVLTNLLTEVQRRIAAHQGVTDPSAARIYWINPVADLAAMNLLEECGGRLCGTELLFSHALDPIPTDLPPLEALARLALADPMVGSAQDRAARILREAQALGAEAVVISRIPGASHCALETGVFRAMIAPILPVLEIEVPPVCDALSMTLRNRLEALMETVRQRRVR